MYSLSLSLCLCLYTSLLHTDFAHELFLSVFFYLSLWVVV